MAPLRLARIHIAVLQNDLLRVRALLHRKPSNVDLQDTKGATPLMLAALIRSPNLVTFLLGKGASWQITDKAGYNASDYARGLFADLYKPFIRRSAKSANQARQIYEHLSDGTVLKTQYRTKATGTLAFQRRGSSLRIFKLIAKHKVARPISNKAKATAACIAAGNSLKPLMCAVSGWTAMVSPGVLDGARYIQVVRDIAKILAFDLARHCYDTPGGGSLQEDIGRYQAVRIIFPTRFDPPVNPNQFL